MNKLWGNLSVGLKELHAIGEGQKKTNFNGLLFHLFMVPRKAQNHCTNYKRNWVFTQIPRTQFPIRVYAVPIVTSSQAAIVSAQS